MTQEERVMKAVNDFLEVMGANGKPCIKAYKEKRVLDDRRTLIFMEYLRAMQECEHVDVAFTTIQAAYRLGAAEARQG